MLALYRFLTYLSAPALKLLLKRRLAAGKEDATRMPERMGHPALPRPSGRLVWIHAASVGEAQSALILTDRLRKDYPDTSILMTSGTRTSAELMQKRLPERAVHQFYPLDNPKWCARFLDHWKPDSALWMESELWPNMLLEIRKRGIPAALVNARLSERSAKRWGYFKGAAQKLLSTFSIVLTQTQKDADRFGTLGAKGVTVTDNLKYSAAPLPYDAEKLTALEHAIAPRLTWIYASTHKGEEALAIETHKHIKQHRKDVLTIIIPRHPERRGEIEELCKASGLSYLFRSQEYKLPMPDTELYIADTLGELGLFYRLTDIAVIGRSFSDDGGGGHNPIEAAQLDCAVLSGPYIQYQTELFEAMKAHNAVKIVETKDDFPHIVEELFFKPDVTEELMRNARQFSTSKEAVVQSVMASLKTILDKSL